MSLPLFVVKLDLQRPSISESRTNSVSCTVLPPSMSFFRWIFGIRAWTVLTRRTCMNISYGFWQKQSDCGITSLVKSNYTLIKPFESSSRLSLCVHEPPLPVSETESFLRKLVWSPTSWKILPVSPIVSSTSKSLVNAVRVNGNGF